MLPIEIITIIFRYFDKKFFFCDFFFLIEMLYLGALASAPELLLCV